MKVVFFSVKPYDREFFTAGNEKYKHELTFLEPRLTTDSWKLAAGHQVVCAFVNDRLDAPVLEKLHEAGCKLIALRCAGYNHVDIPAAARLGMTVVRVPTYSPYAVAEHTVGLMLMLNRKLHKAYNRIREGNFALDGLLGFDMYGKTAGVVGTGKIGAAVAKILCGMGCRVLAYDLLKHRDCEAIGVGYVSLDDLLEASDIVTLHCPLMPETHHLINAARIQHMKNGVMLINAGRGGLIDTEAVIEGLKTGKLGSLGMDVYEHEMDLFFEDRSCRVIQDDVFSRLLTFPNVVITGHQAFFTSNALTAIADQTLSSITAFEKGDILTCEVRPEEATPPVRASAAASR